MARPKANPEQHTRAYHLWRDGKGQTSIFKALTEEFGNAVSERTVATWIRGFKNLDPETVNMDAPFEWHRLDDYGLPWEASYDLLEVWAFYQRLSGLLATRLPTVRQAIWWWRIIKAMPGVKDMHDILSVAGAFEEREIRHEVLAETLDLTDLEACLAFSPWYGWPNDSKCADLYLKAIEVGVIPKLRIPLRDTSSNLNRDQGFSLQQAITTNLAIRGKTWPTSGAEPPWLLPSQQKKDETEVGEKGGRDPFDVVSIRREYWK